MTPLYCHTTHATLTETCVDNVQGKMVVQLSDAMPLQHTASTLLLDEMETLLRDTTSMSTYELLDETSAQGVMNKQLPEATVTSTHELPDETVPLVTGNSQLPEATHTHMQVQSDKTRSSVPINNQRPDVTNRQLPDVTVIQVIQDEAKKFRPDRI